MLVSPVLVRVLVGHTWASQQLLLAEAQGVAFLSRFSQLGVVCWTTGQQPRQVIGGTRTFGSARAGKPECRQAGVKDVFTPACLRVMTPDAARRAAVLVAGRSTVRPRTRGGRRLLGALRERAWQQGEALMGSRAPTKSFSQIFAITSHK